MCDLKKESEHVRGLIQLYSGKGKGKTTAAVGLAVRFAGSGGKVLFTQFMKDGSSSEIYVLRKIPGIQVFSLTEKMGFSFRMTREQKLAARKKNDSYMLEIRNMIQEGDYGLLVMDEAAEAASLGLLDPVLLREFMEHKPEKMEMVITGRDALPEIMEMCDYITTAAKVRHPYDRGVMARKGIEF